MGKEQNRVRFQGSNFLGGTWMWLVQGRVLMSDLILVVLNLRDLLEEFKKNIPTVRILYERYSMQNGDITRLWNVPWLQ
jgi:hypothetical protein